MAGGGLVVVEVTGAKELRRALRQIEDAAARKGLQAELKAEYLEAAKVVAGVARGEAPRRSGRLAGSIKAKATTTGASVTAGGGSVRYAAPIHWGWPSRPNRRKGWRGGPIAGNRFLTRAASKAGAQVAEILGRGLGKFVDRVMPDG